MTKSYPVTIEEIEQKTYELGWNDVGITKALIPEEDILAYHDWLKNSYQGKLSYMENALRCDPQKLFPGAKTAILFISYYKQEPRPFRTDAGLIASYARGRDYHHVHRKRLKQFIRWLEERCGQTDIAKAFSDSSPILEKALAVQAGLGWFGKNTLLIHRRFGTFTLLSGLLTSVEIPLPKIQLSELRLPRCGSCTKCLDACPTQALVSPYKLDATRCLSYHLIESKEPIPPDIQSQNPGYVFGCDICQDVCPHNLRKPFSEQPEFKEEKGWGAYLSLEDLPQLQQHKETLFGTPLQRRKVEGLKHTLETLKKETL